MGYLISNIYKTHIVLFRCILAELLQSPRTIYHDSNNEIELVYLPVGLNNIVYSLMVNQARRDIRKYDYDYNILCASSSYAVKSRSLHLTSPHLGPHLAPTTSGHKWSQCWYTSGFHVVKLVVLCGLCGISGAYVAK